MNETDHRLVQTVVLLERQHLITEHLVETIGGPAIQRMEDALAEGKQGLNHVLDIFNYVFSLIDHLVRFQKIAASLPKFSQKSAEFRALHSKMGDLKNVRNQLQHINNDIQNDYTGPLLGAISWANKSTQFMTTFWDVGRERRFSGTTFKAMEDSFGIGLRYIYNEKDHNLDLALEGAREFNAFILRSVKIETDGKPYNVEEHFVALRVSITPIEDHEQGKAPNP
jgi:hypothetical protein